MPKTFGRLRRAGVLTECRLKLRTQKDAREADHWIKVKKPDDMTVGHRDPERFPLAIDLDSEKVFAPWSRI